MTDLRLAGEAIPKARVLVCGGRNYANHNRIFAVLDRMHGLAPIDVIIHGAAGGADALADEWAKARGVKTLPFPARWETEGRAAGPLRNARMLREAAPHCVIAFPGGRGTADMVQRATKAGVRVLQMA